MGGAGPVAVRRGTWPLPPWTARSLALAIIVSLPIFVVFVSRGAIILYAVLAVMALPLPEVRRRFVRLLAEPAVLALAGLMLWYLLSALWGPELARGGSRGVRNLAELVAALSLVAIALATEPEDQPALDRALAWGGMACAIIFFGAMLTCEWLPDGLLPRFYRGQSTCYRFPMWYGGPAWGILCIPLGLAVLRRLGTRATWLYGALILPSLVLHFKQAAILGLACGLAALLAVLRLGRPAFNAVMAILVGWTLLAPFATLAAIDTSFDQAYARYLPFSWQHRLHIWRVIADHTLEAPIIGNGAGYNIHIRHHLGAPVPFYVDGKLETMQLIFEHPHSSFMQIWMEAGLVGAALAAAGLTALAIRLQRLPLDRPALAVAAGTLASWFIVAATDFEAWETRWTNVVWGVLAITVLVIRMEMAGRWRETAPGP
jgi:O-antigen ligase